MGSMSVIWTAAMAQLLGLGLALGLVGGMLGIGGGLVAIPILALAYGMDQALAQGTALVMIVPNVLVGFWRYQQRQPIKLSRLVSMLLPAMVASRLSARLATTLDGPVLRLSFAMFLLLLTVVMLWQQRQVPRHGELPLLSLRLLPLVGVASGLMSGLFTIGGGLVVVPALVMLFGLRRRAWPWRWCCRDRWWRCSRMRRRGMWIGPWGCLWRWAASPRCRPAWRWRTACRRRCCGMPSMRCCWARRRRCWCEADEAVSPFGPRWADAR
jgi:hypothetical protein